jgi:hypothetical protein
MAQRFAGVLYPKCLAPVEFIGYRQLDASAAFQLPMMGAKLR